MDNFSKFGRKLAPKHPYKRLQCELDCKKKACAIFRTTHSLTNLEVQSDAPQEGEGPQKYRLDKSFSSHWEDQLWIQAQLQQKRPSKVMELDAFPL